MNSSGAILPTGILKSPRSQLAEGGDRAYYTASTLVRVMDACLRLLHPFTPFVTEELWQALKKAALENGLSPFASESKWEDALIIAKWPEAEKAGRLGRRKGGAVRPGAGSGAHHPQPARRKEGAPFKEDQRQYCRRQAHRHTSSTARQPVDTG